MLSKDWRRFSFFLFLSFLLLSLDFLGWTKGARAIAERGLNPLKKEVYELTSVIRHQLSGIRYSRQEYLRLKKRVGELSREAAALKIKNSKLKTENSAARRLLGVSLPPEWRFLPASVLGKRRYLFIDKGKRNGVEKGMVVVFENVLVGKVIEEGERAAKVILLQDKDSKIKVKTAAKVRGVVLGEDGKLILSRVLQNEKLKAGDLVVTSGEDGVFPADLLIGKIKKINKDERKVFQKAEIEPLVDNDKLETVFLIIK